MATTGRLVQRCPLAHIPWAYRMPPLEKRHYGLGLPAQRRIVEQCPTSAIGLVEGYTAPQRLLEGAHRSLPGRLESLLLRRAQPPSRTP